MPKVKAQFTMSLDGFIAGPHDEVNNLFKWYSRGDTNFPVPGSDLEFKISKNSANLLKREWGQLGAIVTGRHDFDVSEAWGGVPPLNLPMFIVTHQAPKEWVKDGSPFTFVTEGVANAIDQARQAAGKKNVSVGGSKIIQQCLRFGLLDEIQIDLAPILLGEGIRLFDNLGNKPFDLEITRVIQGVGVTHIKYRVIR